MHTLTGRHRARHDLADCGLGGFFAAVNELVGRRDPHRQVGMAEVRDQLVTDDRVRSIARRPAPAFASVPAIDDPPNPAARSRSRPGWVSGTS